MNDIEQSIISCAFSVTYLTILSSLDNSLSRLISRIEVLGTPSSSASRRIFFSATMLPVEMSRALYTTP